MRNNLGWLDKLTPEDRIARAKIITSNIVDHVCVAIALHESNKILIFSDAILGQVQKSRAAHTYVALRNSQFNYEIISLCKLWDSVSEDRESIVATIKLIDTPDINAQLANTYGANWPLETDVSKAEARRVTVMLKSAIRAVELAEKCERMKRIRAVRDEYIAHILKPGTKTNALVSKMQYGDTKWLLDRTIKVVDWLQRSINGTSFDWEHSRDLHRKRAEFFWHGVTVNVKG